MDKLLGRLSRCYRPLGSFPQTTSSPPISSRRISIFITPVGPAPLNARPNSHSVMVCPSRKQRPALPSPVSRFRQPKAPSRRTKSARSASSSTICRCSMPLTSTWCSVPGLSSLACLGICSPQIPIPYAICPVSQQRPHALCSSLPNCCIGVNGLNGAKRLNDLNDLNGYLSYC
jgi:hypothetical protein